MLKFPGHDFQKEVIIKNFLFSSVQLAQLIRFFFKKIKVVQAKNNRKLFNLIQNYGVLIRSKQNRLYSKKQKYNTFTKCVELICPYCSAGVKAHS